VNSDLFYTRLSAGGVIQFSTLLGGRGNDAARAVALDGSGQVVIAGLTLALDFPTTGGVAVPAPPGGGDAFLVRIDPTGGPTAPDLTITKTHSGNFVQGQVGATYTITVHNPGSAAT